MKKETTIKIRISQEDKSIIQNASDASGLSMSNIIINSSIAKAKKILKEIEKKG